MTVFIQLPERWGDVQAGAAYRVGFAAHVRTHANPHADRVVVVEPNPWLAEELEAQWRWFPQAAVLRTDAQMGGVSGDQSTQVETPYFYVREETPFHFTFSPDEKVVERRFPHFTIEQIPVATMSLNELLRLASDGEPIALLSIDARRTSAAELSIVDWSSVEPRQVALTVTGLPTRPRMDCEQVLRQAGFHLAGRPWGAAGDTQLLVRPEGFQARVKAASAQAKVAAGQAAVTVRDSWVGPTNRRRWRDTARVLSRRRQASDVLDARHGSSLAPPTREEVEVFLAESPAGDGEPWQVTLGTNLDPMQEAAQCHATHGIWPISFSYPRLPFPINPHPTKLISPITPGFPYSYENERDYLAGYEGAFLGITHRKAGWDCFRHIEIMAAGAVPLMLDADRIPRFSMVHYPKRAMEQAVRQFRHIGSAPSDDTRKQFRRHFEQHLTTSAMAAYVIKASGLEDAQKVMFVDERLAGHADYVSVMTLIGLKQLLGSRCLVPFPVDYVYEDTDIDTGALYGRGFGYTRVLPSHARSAMELGDPGDELDAADVVVIGSVTRNSGLAYELMERFPARRTIWIHGEDLPPMPEEVRQYREAGVHVFVRAIHVNN